MTRIKINVNLAQGDTLGALGQVARSSSEPARVRFVALDLPGTPAITLPYNPETFTSTPSPQWTPQDTAGVEFPSSDWTGNKPRRWKLKHTLQRYDGAQVETILTQLETWSERPTQSTNRPTLILAEWGPHNEIGHIENLQTRRLIFDSNLNTTWGEYEFDLVRNNTINVG